MKLPRSHILAGLPDLSSEARARIHAAYENAVEHLVEGSGEAWQAFVETRKRARAGTATDFDLIQAFQAAQQSDVMTEIKAHVLLFDAIAGEYSGIDLDHRAYVDRLHTLVLVAVRSALPVRRDAGTLVLDTLMTRILSQERRTLPEAPRSSPVHRQRGKPSRFPAELKERALKVRMAGGSNSEAARILYATSRPTAQQVKNISAILKYYRKASSSGNR
ncbi:MAG: hypothetical protein ACKV22_12320 [Bryobacteraceae bacterium]